MVKQSLLWTKVGYLIGIILFLSSCSGTKHLTEDELVLSRITYKILTEDSKIKKATIKNDLNNLVKQKPINKNVLNPRTYGTPLTIYDKKLTAESVESFQQFLQNRKGFYHAEVDFTEVKKGRYIEVIYTVDLGNRYYIANVKHVFEDSIMSSIIDDRIEESEIIVGEPLEANVFDREKARIVNILKNEGYANFNGNYIEYRGDSISQQVDVTIYVYNPVGRDNHIRYEIGDINVYTEHSPTVNPEISLIDSIEHNYYYSKTDRFLVHPSNLNDVLSLKNGALYRKSSETKTNQNLTRLSPYRFAVIDPYVANDSIDIYNYNIFLAPYSNKWILDSGLNLFYSSISSNAGQNLFGFSGNLGFQNRNFKNRAIRQSIGLEGTLEFNLPNFPSFNEILTNTISLRLNNKYEIPKVIDIFRITNVLNRLNFISDESLANVSADGTTTADMSVGYTSIYNFYDLLNLNMTWTYRFQPNPRLRYTIHQIGIDVINTNIDPVFQANILDDNTLLEKSFEDNLFTGFLFRELSVLKRTKETLGGSHFIMLGDFELSGFENYLINGLVNAVSSYDKKWQIGGLEFSEFVRLEGDIRYYKKVKERSSFAARFNTAVALPYSNDEVVPYIKQYFVGGPNSVRGWQLRELGPGSYQQEDIDGTAFFQTGDFKLDFNAEYRFDLFWYLEGAIFLDGGNVWLLKEDPARPGAQLSGNFLDQIALATGWGLRMDFDYFIFRFDFGYKLRSPFPDPETNSRIVLTNSKFNDPLGNISFAINYPF